MTLYVLSGVARMKQFQRLLHVFSKTGKWPWFCRVYAMLCNVCKNMNLRVFIYVSALICSSSIVLLNSYGSIEFICQYNDIDV